MSTSNIIAFPVRSTGARATTTAGTAGVLRFESAATVPAAKSTLGRMVIEQVCADLARLRADGTALKRIAINVSAHQLNIDAKLLEFIDQTLCSNGLEHADLEFELVERQALSAEQQGLQTLQALAERGCRIGIDDFGTGYSSISYLTDLPVSGFKLDRSLIGQLDEQKSITVVSGLLAMAHHLGLDVVAEGIETEAQHETLLASSCRQGQGFGHSRPMPLPTLIGFLAAARVNSLESVGALV